MAYEVYEGLDNAGDLLKALSAAVKKDSDGGATITVAEIINILTTVGVTVAKDIADDEPDEE